MKYLLISLLVVIFLVAVGWAGYVWIITNFQPPEESAEFGDTFGAVNALFSSLALAGVVITIWMQQTELSHQKQELRDTRQEFQIQRATNIIFKQLELLDRKFEKIQQKESLQGYHSLFKGLDGKVNWGKILESAKDNKSYQELDLGGINTFSSLKDRLISLRPQIRLAIYLIKDSCDLVQKIIDNDDLDTDSRNELKLLLIKNLDSHFIKFRDKMMIFFKFLENSSEESDCRVLAVKLEEIRDLLREIDQFFPKSIDS